MGMFGKIRTLCSEYGLGYTFRKVWRRAQIKYRVGRRLYPFSQSKASEDEQRDWKPENPVYVSILVPLYNTPPRYLREMLDSVMAQTYPCWELCMVDASDDEHGEVEKILQEYIAQDSLRIRYRKIANQGISANTNEAAGMTRGTYMALLDHDDLLHPSALYHMVRALEQTHADVLYSDELSFDGAVSRVQSIHLKPDFARTCLHHNNYICHFTMFSKTLWDQVGGFDSELDGSQDYDLILRLTDAADKVVHVPKVLYYWRMHAASVAAGVEAKPYTIEAGRRALEMHLQRQGMAGSVSSVEELGPYYRMEPELPQQAVLLIIVENARVDRRMRSYIQMGTLFEKVYVVELEKLTSEQAAQADYVILVRDGYLPEHGDGRWILELIRCLQPEDNLVAAPLVKDRKNRVVHAGYTYDHGHIYPMYQGVPARDPSYMYRLAFRENVSLLAGAALAMKAPVFLESDLYPLEDSEQLFEDATWFDFCLQARVMQGDCVWTPYEPFVRTESTNAGSDKIRMELFYEKWADTLGRTDPFGHPDLPRFGKYAFICHRFLT